MWRGTLEPSTGVPAGPVPSHKELHSGTLVFVQGAGAGTAVERSGLRGRSDQHQYGGCVDAAAGIGERGADEGRSDRRVPATTRTLRTRRGSGAGEGDRDGNRRTESTTDDDRRQAGTGRGTAQEGSAGLRTKALNNRTGRDRQDAGHWSPRQDAAAAPTAAGRQHAGRRRGRIGADPPGRWHPDPGKG